MWTPVEIANGIQANLTALDDLVDQVTKAGHEAAVTEAKYKIDFAKARLTVKATALERLTVSDIEAEATIQCEDSYLAFLIAENKLTTIREALRATQSKLDGYRTLSASIRGAGG